MGPFYKVALGTLPSLPYVRPWPSISVCGRSDGKNVLGMMEVHFLPFNIFFAENLFIRLNRRLPERFRDKSGVLESDVSVEDTFVAKSGPANRAWKLRL